MFTLDTFYKSDEWIKLRDILIAQRLNNNSETICEYVSFAFNCKVKIIKRKGRLKDIKKAMGGTFT